MASRAEIRSDLELRITGGKPSDDIELDPRQVNFWIDMLRSKLMEDKLMSQEAWADADSGFATMFDCIDIKSESLECGTECNTRYYIELPGQVAKIKNDLAIVSVRTIGNHAINRVRVTDLDALKYIQMAKPSPDNMVYYRINRKLYILGPSLNFLKKGDVIVVAILSTTDVIGDNDDYPIPDNLVGPLLDALEAIARRQMQSPQDLINDGKS